jgi:bifunctional non-homologous end joining protein LigD
MLPSLVDGLPDRAGWVFEPKWDGWRCLAILDDGSVDLRSRRAVDLGPYFPELSRTLHPLAGRRAVLDGEIVVLRNGRPDFDAISGRLAARRLSDWAARTSPATFVAFDLLELDGRTLVDEPHTVRREALAALGLNGPRWATTTADGDGEAVWAATEELGLEGVVCKDPRSTWVARRSRRWLKCKHWRYGTFRVMGWAPSTSREPAGLVVGAPGAVGELRVAGVAALNIEQESQAAVMSLIDELRTDQVPAMAPRWRRPVQWIDDGLVAEVRYLERTPTGFLRHASAGRSTLAVR